MKKHSTLFFIFSLTCLPVTITAKRHTQAEGSFALTSAQLIDETQKFLATPEAHQWDKDFAEFQKKEIEKQLNGNGNLYKKASPQYSADVQKALDEAGVTDPVLIVAMKKKNPLKGKMLAGALAGRVIAIDEESAQAMSDHIKQHVYRHEATHIKYKDPLMEQATEAIICTQKEHPTPAEIVKELNNNQKQAQKRVLQLIGKEELNRLMHELEAFRERRAEEEAAQATNCPACTTALAHYMQQFEEKAVDYTKKQLHRRSNSGYFSSKDFIRIAREQSKLCAQHAKTL